jgi:hypothetical protein
VPLQEISFGPRCNGCTLNTAGSLSLAARRSTRVRLLPSLRKRTGFESRRPNQYSRGSHWGVRFAMPSSLSPRVSCGARRHRESRRFYSCVRSVVAYAPVFQTGIRTSLCAQYRRRLLQLKRKTPASPSLAHFSRRRMGTRPVSKTSLQSSILCRRANLMLL